MGINPQADIYLPLDAEDDRSLSGAYRAGQKSQGQTTLSSCLLFLSGAVHITMHPSCDYLEPLNQPCQPYANPKIQALLISVLTRNSHMFLFLPIQGCC